MTALTFPTRWRSWPASPGSLTDGRVPGVTLLGDAAHLMIPYGEGSNIAMYDGAELGKAIAASPDDVEAALTAYEKDLFPRSTSESAEAEVILKLCLGGDAPQSLLDFLPATSPSNGCPHTGSRNGFRFQRNSD